MRLDERAEYLASKSRLSAADKREAYNLVEMAIALGTRPTPLFDVLANLCGMDPERRAQLRASNEEAWGRAVNVEAEAALDPKGKAPSCLTPYKVAKLTFNQGGNQTHGARNDRFAFQSGSNNIGQWRKKPQYWADITAARRRKFLDTLAIPDDASPSERLEFQRRAIRSLTRANNRSQLEAVVRAAAGALRPPGRRR
jgi:hypothetical protein